MKGNMAWFHMVEWLSMNADERREYPTANLASMCATNCGKVVATKQHKQLTTNKESV